MWKLFTKGRKGFSHVFAIRYDTKNDIWTKYEFSTHGFRFESYKGEEADILFANMMNYWTCLDVVVEDKPVYIANYTISGSDRHYWEIGELTEHDVCETIWRATQNVNDSWSQPDCVGEYVDTVDNIPTINVLVPFTLFT